MSACHYCGDPIGSSRRVFWLRIGAGRRRVYVCVKCADFLEAQYEQGTPVDNLTPDY